MASGGSPLQVVIAHLYAVEAFSPKSAVALDVNTRLKLGLPAPLFFWETGYIRRTRDGKYWLDKGRYKDVVESSPISMLFHGVSFSLVVGLGFVLLVVAIVVVINFFQS